MATTPTIPFWAGNSSCLKWIIERDTEALHIVSWTIEQVVTKGRDHVNGERRARPWVVIDGYDIRLVCAQHDVAAFKRLLDITLERAEQYWPPLQHDISLIVKPLDGTSHGFMTVGQVIVGGWELGVGTSSMRNSLSVTFHAQDVMSVPA